MIVFSEQTVQDKEETKKKQEEELIKRLKDKEEEKTLKEELWKQEKIRRNSNDKPWNVDAISSGGDNSKKEVGKDHKEKESEVCISKLEETILKVQQQMAEGSDHVNFEMKMKEEDKDNRKFEHKHIKENEHLQKSSHSVRVKEQTLSKSKKTPSPKKIKVRVEMDKNKSAHEKVDKKIAANTIVSIMVPFFKQGKITARDVFKCCAKEFTTLMLDSQWTNDPKDGPIPLSCYSKYVIDFFASCGTISSEDGVKSCIRKFKDSLDKNK